MYHKETMRIQDKNQKTAQIVENSVDLVNIGFSFPSDWLQDQ